MNPSDHKATEFLVTTQSRALIGRRLGLVTRGLQDFASGYFLEAMPGHASARGSNSGFFWCEKGLRLIQEADTEFREKGRVLDEQRRYYETLDAFDRALEADPHNIVAWYWKGWLLGTQHRWEEALAAFDRALEVDPDNSLCEKTRFVCDSLCEKTRFASWYEKGNILDAQGRYEEALAAFEEALAINPGDRDSWHNKGCILDRLGRRNEAVAAFDRALTIDAAKKLVEPIKSPIPPELL